MADTPYQGFIGATYGGDARHLAAEQCINLYPEPTGAPGTNPKRPLALRHTPGLKAFSVAGLGSVRGIFYDPGVERLFYISGGEFYEVGEGGAATKLGDVATGVLPVTWASNGVGGQQIMDTSGNQRITTTINGPSRWSATACCSFCRPPWGTSTAGLNCASSTTAATSRFRYGTSTARRSTWLSWSRTAHSRSSASTPALAHRGCSSSRPISRKPRSKMPPASGSDW